MESDAVVDLLPVESERLSAQAFLRLMKNNPALIKSASVVAPKPGSRDFGGFFVTYTRPIHKSVNPKLLARLKR